MTIPTFSDTVRFTAILISRVLLNLQAVNQKQLRLARDDPLHSSRMYSSEDNGPGAYLLAFSRFDVVGSLGASLAVSKHPDDLEFPEDNFNEDGQADTIGEPGAPMQSVVESSSPTDTKDDSVPVYSV